jgi:hypothetical protein
MFNKLYSSKQRNTFYHWEIEKDFWKKIRHSFFPVKATKWLLTFTHTHTHTHTHIYIYIYIHKHSYIHTHTHIHIYIYTQTVHINGGALIYK